MDKNLVLKAISAYSDNKSDAFNTAIYYFLNGISDSLDTYRVEDFNSPFVFVEMAVCVLLDPTEMSLSERDFEVIDQMNYIAQDIANLM